MSKYNIERWDAVMSSNGVNMTPMIFLTPDSYFLEFVKNNDYNVAVQIHDTDSGYDNKFMRGFVAKSSFLPNFFKSTNLYVVMLECAWNGYPPNNGSASFSGIKG